MDINIDSKLVGGLVCLMLLGAGIHAKQRSKTYNFPPSPPKTVWSWARFEWGHHFPMHRGFLQVEEWIKECGPVISIRNRGKTIVLVGRHQAAVEIMERQAASTADRPSNPAGDLLSGGLRFAFLPGGEQFRKMRKAVNIHLQPKVAATYEPIQSNNVKNTILDLLDNPDRYTSHAVRYGSAVIQKIAYGKNTPTSADDPEVRKVYTSIIRIMYVMTPGRYIVNTFPFLKYIPWYGRELRKWRQEDTDLYMAQINRVRKQIESGEDVGPSFARYVLDNHDESGLSELQMAYVAGSLFIAGSETVSLGICCMMLSAALHPEAQAKVHAELDAITGQQRAPTFADEPMLPQLQAFILESFRWRPVIAPGAPHQTNADVVWGGYSIPAGTTIMANHWAICRDPDVFPEPEEFLPERWLTSDGRIRDDLKSPTFGYGRRQCPGQHVALRSVYINTVLTLWAFRLSVSPNEPIDDLAFTGGIMPTSSIPKISFEKRMNEKVIRSMIENYGEGA